MGQGGAGTNARDRLSALRVLFAITRGEVGGAQEHLRTLAQGLIARGVEVGVAVEDPSPLRSALEDLRVRVWPRGSITRNPHPTRDLRARHELSVVLAEFRPDVLALYSSKAGALGRGLLRPPHGVTVFTCHHAPFGPGRQLSHRLIARPIEQFTLPLLDGIISDGARDVPMLRRLAPTVPIEVIPNAIAVHQRPLSPSRPVTTALWVARLRRPKDPIQLVRAWHHVVESHPDAALLMCGDGPLRSKLEERIARSPVRSNIDYRGLVADLAPEYERASVFVLTTKVEGGLTMATLEAMAHGLVPVVSDAGDAFLLEHERAGVVVPLDSPATVGKVVAELFNDPARLLELRANAIEYARKTWTADLFVERTAAFYLRLLDRTRA